MIVHLSGGSGEVEVRLIRLKCRLGASHTKIAENNVALTTIAIDVPQCSASKYKALMFCLRRRKQNIRARSLSIKLKQQVVHVPACGFICDGVEPDARRT